MADRERRYDLTVANQGLIVVRDRNGVPQWKASVIPCAQGDDASVQDREQRWKTMHFGAGFGRTSVDGGYSHAENLDCSEPGLVLPGPAVTTLTISGSANTAGFFELSSKLYVLAGRYCKRIDPSDDTVKAPNSGSDGMDFGAGAAATEAVNFGGNIYIAFSSDTAIQKFTGTAWSNIDPDTSAATSARATHFAKDWLDGYGWRLWGSYSSFYVKGCDSNPLQAADWGPATPYSIGDGGHAITDMVSAGNRIFIAKTNGLYGLDCYGRSSNIMESVELLVDSDNGKQCLYADGAVFYPHLMGLIRYNRSDESMAIITPFAATGNTSAITGKIVGQVSLGLWHYLAIYNGTDSYILKGRSPSSSEAVPQGWIGPMIWHPFVKLAGSQITCLYLSGLTSPPRLWFGIGANCGYIRIPKSGSVLSEIANMTFSTAGSLYLSPEDFSQPGNIKDAILFYLENQNISSANSAQIQLAYDGGAYAAFGSPATSPSLATINRPSTGIWRGYKTYARIDLANAATASTAAPRLLPLVGRAATRPDMRQIIDTSVYCEDELELRDGSHERVSGQGLLTHLLNQVDAAPVTISDYWTGSIRNRTCLVHKVVEGMVGQDQRSPAAYGADVQFSILSEP